MIPLSTISDALREWAPCSSMRVASAVGIGWDEAYAGLLALQAISCASVGDDGDDGDGDWHHRRTPHPRALDVRPYLNALMSDRSNIDVAAEMGVPQQMVHRYRRAMGLPTTQAATIDDVFAGELRLGGCTYAEIAHVMGCSYGGARHAVDRIEGRSRR